MSDISFLKNANEGKNTKGSYLLTIAISIVGGTFASILIIVLLLILYFMSMGSSGLEAQNIISKNPMFLLVLVGISYGIYFLLFYLCIKFIHKKRFMALINVGKHIKWSRILKGAGLWVLIMGLFTILSMFNQTGNITFHFQLNSFIILLILSLIVFPIQASFEEIFFRGYLMQGIGLLAKKPIVPLILTSLIFGLIHFYNGTSAVMSFSIVISACILGLMLGIIVLGENGLETAMGAHIANNMYVALVLNSTDSGLGNLPSLMTVQSTDPFSGIPILIIMASLMLILIFWNKKEDFFKIFN